MDKCVLHDHIIPQIQGIEKGDTLYIVSDILRLSIVSKEMGFFHE